MAEYQLPLTPGALAGLPQSTQEGLWARHLLRILPLIHGDHGRAEEVRLIDACGKWVALRFLGRSPPALEDLPGIAEKELDRERRRLPEPFEPPKDGGAHSTDFWELEGVPERLRMLYANCAVGLQVFLGIEPRAEFFGANLPETGLLAPDASQLPRAQAMELVHALRGDLEALRSADLASPTGRRAALYRPLFPGALNPAELPGAWPNLFDHFLFLAQRVGLPELGKEYARLVRGQPLAWEPVEERLAAWLESKRRPKRRKRTGKPSPPERPNLRMLEDAALQDEAGDRLDFKVYADAIAGLIDNPDTGTPLTMAINGPWGSGKTTLAGMVQRRLEQKPAAGGEWPHVTCWFNAWMHDEAKQLAAAFAAAVAKAADRRRSLWRRLLSPLPTAILPPSERLARRLKIAAGIIALAVAIALPLGLAWDWQPNDVLVSAGSILSLDLNRLGPLLGTTTGRLVVLLIVAFTAGRWIASTAGAVSRFVRDPAATANAGAMDKVRDQLGELIRQATPRGSRFVVFVDDLERCRPPGPVDVLEVVNQLLPHENIVTVVIADMPAVVACAEIKYRELAERYQPGGRPAGKDGSRLGVYGRFYLQKMIQLQFDLPRQRSETIREMLAESVAAEPAGTSEGGEGAPGRRAAPPIMPRFSGLVERSWRPGFSVAAIRAEIADREDLVQRLAGYALWLYFLPLVWITSHAANQAYPPVQLPAACSAARLRAVRGWRVLALLAYLAALPSAIWFFLSRSARELVGDPWWAVPAALAAFGLLGSGLLASLEARFQRRLDRRQLAAARRAAQEQIGAGIEDAEKLAAAVRSATSLESEEGGQAIVREALDLKLVNESELMAEAWKTVLVYLPRLPRSAKRLLNHLRLTLFVAHSRGIFGGRPKLRPAHVGKWVVLRERWPELAQRLSREPDRLAELEGAAGDPEKFAGALAALKIECGSVEVLRGFCGKTPKNLGKVLPRLVHFVPIARRG